MLLAWEEKKGDGQLGMNGPKLFFAHTTAQRTFNQNL